MFCFDKGRMQPKDPPWLKVSTTKGKIRNGYFSIQAWIRVYFGFSIEVYGRIHILKTKQKKYWKERIYSSLCIILIFNSLLNSQNFWNFALFFTISAFWQTKKLNTTKKYKFLIFLRFEIFCSKDGHSKMTNKIGQPDQLKR